MKRRLKIVTPCIFMIASCLLSSCAAPSSASTGSPVPSPASSSPDIQKCTPSTNAGYYVSNQYFSGSSSLTYVDYSSMQEIFLCANPNCTHNSDACVSYYPFDGKTQLSGVQVAGEHLLAIQVSPSDNSNAHIDLLNLDGTYLSCLAELSSGQEFCWDISNGYYTDGDSLYTVLSEVDPTTAAKRDLLIRISLKDGAISRLYESPDLGYQLQLTGASQRTLLFWEYDARNFNNVTETLKALDVDTGDTKQLPHQYTESTGIVVNASQICTIDWENAAFDVCTYPSESGISCDYSALREEIIRQYGTIVNEGIKILDFTEEYCAVTFSVQDTSGDTHQVVYLYNIKSGETTEFSLMQTFKDEMVQVCAATPYGLFVRKDIQAKPYTDASGITQDLYLTEWGTISMENYLHSIPEYSNTAMIELP